MELMEQHAAHDILVISDSDVRVTPDYLRSVALPFSDRARRRHHLPLSRRGRAKQEKDRPVGAP